MTAREYAVKAEYITTGGTAVLRRGFQSREEAEDHPVILSLWKRVWVEEVEPPFVPSGELPPLPWDWTVVAHPTANGSFQTYIVDASGLKIAVVWGKGLSKAKTAERIVAAVNGWKGDVRA